MRRVKLLRLLGALLLGGLGAGLLRVGTSGQATAQTPTRMLQVLVRIPSGPGVPGLTITLVPQPRSLGGPVGGAPRIDGTTDRTGQATFVDVRPGMWRVQLAGAVAG